MIRNGIVNAQESKYGSDTNQRIGNMKNTHNKLTCLFGHHDYSKRRTKDKDGDSIYLCKICKRSGLEKWKGYKIWWDYGEEGNAIHSKWDDGEEQWFGKNGSTVHKKYSDGSELWKDNDGNWVDKKPKNWKREIIYNEEN